MARTTRASIRARVVPPLRWLMHQIRVLFDVHANPATFVYLFTLLVTTVVIGAAGHRLSGALLRTQSTNLANLRHHPIQVLFTSAFWLDAGVGPALLVVPFAVVLAPAERWLGTRRWLTVFALGHVGASMLTAGVIQFQLDHGWASKALVRTIDVGFSYGFAAVLGVLTHRVAAQWRVRYVLAITAALVVGIAISATFTDVGHLVAWGIGLGCRVFVPRSARPQAPPTASETPFSQVNTSPNLTPGTWSPAEPGRRVPAAGPRRRGAVASEEPPA
jgi:rhomboid family protein